MLDGAKASCYHRFVENPLRAPLCLADRGAEGALDGL